MEYSISCLTWMTQLRYDASNRRNPMKLKALFILTLLSQSLVTQAFSVKEERAIKLLQKLTKSQTLSFDGHAMGKAYYQVNETLCLFQAESETLSCNDIEISKGDQAAIDLEQMIQLGLVRYEGSAMGGKSYFENDSKYCYISTQHKDKEEVLSLSCQK